MNQYIKQYQKSNIETASREQILIMLYDGCIQFLNKAKLAFPDKNYEEIHNNLMGAQRILNEFINTLDHDVNPQLSANLQSLYEYFIRRLVQANVKHQIEPVEEVLRLVKNLRNTWAKAIEIYHKEQNNPAADEVNEYDEDESDDDKDDESEE